MSQVGNSPAGLSSVSEDRFGAVFTYQLYIEFHVSMPSVVPLLPELVFPGEPDAAVWQRYHFTEFLRNFVRRIYWQLMGS